MRKILFALTALILGGGVAHAQQTIDQLGHASALSGPERIPMFQSVNPAVYALTTDLATFMWASPNLTGTPIAPTAPTATNNTQIATTAYVKAQNYTNAPSPLTANAIVLGVGGAGNGLTSLNSLGTSTTVLHGGAGPPTFSAVNLAADVGSTILGVANGGTGLASGTSGGIPYYSGATSIASTAALTANVPIIGGGAGVAPSSGSRTGNTTTYASFSGTPVSGHCVSIDGSLNLTDAGGACTTGGGGGTVTSSPGGQITWYSATGNTVVGNPNITASSGAVTFGQAASVKGSLILAGNTSSSVTIQPQASAGGWTLTLPNTGGSASGQLVQTDGSGNWSYQSIANDLATGTADLSLSGSTLATLSTTATTNAQAGASYTFLASDNKKFVTRTNGSAQTDTLPQATGSFATGWSTRVYTTAAQDTITPTTSTINGASTLVMGTKQGANIWADGTGNYSALLSLPQPVASAVFTANSSGVPLWTAGSATNVVHGDGSIANIANASLQNASTTVAGQTCTLGASCSIAVTNLSNVGGGTVIANNGSSSAPPNATTAPVLGVPGTSTGTIGLAGSTSGTVTVSAQNTAGTWTMQLPATGGSAGQFLQTNGATPAVTSWANPSGTGTVNSGAQYALGYYATAGTAISGSSAIATNANNNLSFGSGLIGNVRLVSDANDTMAATDFEVDFTSLTAARTEQLPACVSGNKGQQFIVKDEAQKSFFFNITITAASSGTIENATQATLNSNGASITAVCEGNGNYAAI